MCIVSKALRFHDAPSRYSAWERRCYAATHSAQGLLAAGCSRDLPEAAESQVLEAGTRPAQYLDLGLLAKCCKDGAGITPSRRDEVAEIPERLVIWVDDTVGKFVSWPYCPSSNTEEDKAVPLATLELFDTMGPPAIEERVVGARVHHVGVLLTQLSQGCASIIIRPISEFAADKIRPQSPRQADTCIVPIAMQPCAVVVVYRDARAREIHQQGRWRSLAKPRGEEAKDVGPHPCSCVHNNLSAPIADEPQRVRMNKLRAVWQDV